MHLTNWRDFLKFLRPISTIGRRRSRKPLAEGSTSVEPLEVRVLPAANVLSIEATAPALRANVETSSVTYTVNFDRDVIMDGVDASDFHVVTTGSVQFNPALTVVSVNRSTYTVTIDGLRGTGDLRLDLIDDDTILDEFAVQNPQQELDVPLGGTGLYNGSFQGDTYQLAARMPSVRFINRIVPPDDAPYATTIEYYVQFTEAVTGVDATDFDLVLTGGVAVANPIQVTGTNAEYTVTISGISGNGTIGLNLVDDGSIHDNSGYRLVPTGAQLSFAEPGTVSIGGTARSIAAADMNGDGFTDVVASTFSGYLSVALGNGDGTFQSPLTYSVSPSIGRIAVRDLNGDGNPDVVVINSYTNTFDIYRGNGDGTLQFFQSLSSGISQSAVALNFADADGYPDIVITSATDGRADVFSNSGSGVFFPAPSLATGNNPSDIAFGDLNADGYLDLVITNIDDATVSVFLSQAGGGFGAPQTIAAGTFPNRVALGDIDFDGDLDLVVSNEGDPTFSLMLGDGDGTFQPQVTYGTVLHTGDVELIDINGDSRSDLVISDFGNSTFTVHLSNGDGTLAIGQTFAASPVPGDLIVGDFNEDGRLDVLIAETELDDLRLVLNTSIGGFIGEIFSRSNVAPSITSSAEVTVPENTPTTTDVVVITAVDTDTPPQTLIYSISGTDAARFDFNPATGSLRFKVSPDYENPADANSDNTYQVTVTVNDGFGGVTQQSLVIMVDPVNDNLPVFTFNDEYDFVENAAVGDAIFTVNATDADEPGDFIVYSVSGEDVDQFDYNGELREIRFKTSPDYENPTDADGDNVYVLVITADDGHGQIQTRTVRISVLPLNDNNPIFEEQTNNISVPENTPNSDVILTVQVSDADLPGDTLRFSLDGPDAEQFTIDEFTGEIRFLNSPDYENPTDADHDNEYHITVVVSDYPENSRSANFTINVTRVNDNSPVIEPIGPVSVQEETPATTVLFTVSATDADLPQQSLTYGLSGPDAEQFSISGETGEVRFLVSPSYDSPTDQNHDNVYNITVRVSDGNGAVTTLPVTVTVLAINEFLPVISSSPTASVPENTPASTVVLDVDATDADTPSQTLTYSISGVDAELFTIDSANGQIRFRASPDFELPGDASGNNEYNLTVTVSDGNGGTRSQELTITVTPVDDNPLEFTSSDTIEVDENFDTEAVVLDVNAQDADLPSPTITYSLSGVDAEHFTIDANTGEIRFRVSPDYESPVDQDSNNLYQITVTARESGEITATQNITISMWPIDDNPTILVGPFAASVPENFSTSDVALAFTATDADVNDFLEYYLSGVDAELFTIDSETGEIRFRVSPDYEAPADSDHDNVYDLVVTVYSGGDEGGMSGAVTITVLPVNDNTPSVTSGSSASVNENIATSAVVLDVNATDADQPSQTLTYSLSGVDAGLFTIDSNGQIRFLASPNFEAPADSDHNGVYLIRVTVTDSGDPARSIAQDLTIAVNDVNEAPTADDLTVETDKDAPLSIQLVGSDPDAGTSLGYFIETEPLHGTLSEIEEQPGSFVYTPNPGYVGPDSFTYRATDDSLNSNLATVSITVNLGNSPPVIEDATVSIAENSPNGTLVTTVIATDEDITDGLDSDAITFAITGGDTEGAFSIDPSNGELRVSNVAALNFEVRQQIVLQITVTDLLQQSSVATITVNITNVNEPLIIGLPSQNFLTYRTNGAPVPIDPQATVFDEDLTRTDYHGGRLTISVSMTDPNQANDPHDRLGLPVEGSGPGRLSIVSNYIVYDSPLNIIGTIVSGLDGGPLVIDLTTFSDDLTTVPALLRAITFYNTSSNPLPGARTITFELVDGPGENSGVKSKQLNFVTESADPVIVPGHAVEVTRGSAPVLLTSDATLTDVDSVTLKGGRLTVTAGAGAKSSDKLRILRTGGIKISGKNVLFNGNKIGRLTATRNSITVDFNTDAATPLAAQQLLRSLAFSTTSKFSGVGPRTYNITVTDGGGGQFTTTQSVSVIDRAQRSAR